MMRSRAASSRSLTEMIRDNPFLCVAFLAGVSLAALESDVGSESILALMWKVLGFGFHLTATWPERMMPDIPDWLGIGMGIALGLLPYLIADFTWRRLRGR